MVLLLIAGGCGADPPAEPSDAPVTLWIAPGTYHLGAADSEALSVEDLPAALEAALAGSVAPSVLQVRTLGDEAHGYDFIVARNAACEAGVRRLDYDLAIPAGSATALGEAGRAQGTEQIEPPCAAGGDQPDSAEVDVVARAHPHARR